jgi:hypothetical protein
MEVIGMIEAARDHAITLLLVGAIVIGTLNGISNDF